MKIIKLLSLICLSVTVAVFTANNAYSLTNKKIDADIGTKRIPQGTILELKLIDPISSASMALGDEFSLMTMQDTIIDKNIIIPAGSVIRGAIQKVNSRRMLSKGASIYLDFDHVVSPTGKQVPLAVGICYSPNITIDGGIGNGQNYGTAIKKNAQITANIVKTSTKWGWETGENVLEGYPKYVLTPLAAMASAPVAGIYFLGGAVVDLFRKGDDISLNQGDTIKVMLLKPLDMPIN